ncbi:MAG: hypothetical protein V1809_05250 [Planctomycetota bacterium]
MSPARALISMVRAFHDWTGRRISTLDTLERRGIGRFLETCDPDALEAEGRRLTLAAFQRAAKRVPAYRELLGKEGVAPESVTTLEDFRRRVPITGKHNTFATFPIDRLCVDGDPGDLASVVTSSGHSGIFAFGLTGRSETAADTRAVDFALDYHFAAGSRRTLLVNVLPMGVKVSSRLCTVADVSVREDMALGIIKALGPRYDQIILLGDPNFIKLLLEEGRDHYGIDWRHILLHVVVGEEYVSETWRTYIAGLIGSADPSDRDEGMVAFTMGAAEIGLNFLTESADIIRLRRGIVENQPLRDCLACLGNPCTPMIYQYNPLSTHIEEMLLGTSGRFRHLLVTTIDPDRRLPLIRYRLGDMGRIFPYSEFCRRLEEFGAGDLRPRLRLPVAVVLGRNEFIRATRAASGMTPNFLKDALYRDPQVAGAATGNFRMSLREGRILVEVQIRPGAANADPTELAARFETVLRRQIASACDQPYFRAFDDCLHNRELPAGTPREWINIFETERESLRPFLEKSTGRIFRADGDFLAIRFYPHDEFPYPVDWERKISYVRPEDVTVYKEASRLER